MTVKYLFYKSYKRGKVSFSEAKLISRVWGNEYDSMKEERSGWLNTYVIA